MIVMNVRNFLQKIFHMNITKILLTENNALLTNKNKYNY